MTDKTSGDNRLAGESSPYLLLHRHNPVDWYPWGREALERARREDRPIFLSVGYSTCYWCHVMERESFSDPAIADLMNREFVNVKVDREERPDLDEIYMVATQLLTQHGGWPNSVFLTPELKPFFAGTYFPPEPRRGMPGFPTVLESLAEAWRSRRGEVEEQAESVSAALTRYLEDRGAGAEAPPPPEVAASAAAELERRFDDRWGGFGGAPKFPTPSNLMLLDELAGERPRAAEMLDATLDAMARGGIYDQLGGGFHRYATDREWKIPHFEKMLYDNGLLLELYARAWRRSADPECARIVRETVAFLAREMTSPEGAFWSAIDAETDGHEGAYYVWTRDELREVLGEESFGFLAPIYGFDTAPFFEGTHYVLHLPARLAEQGIRRRMEAAEVLAEIEPLKARLLAARDRRPRPLTDDKILTDWNGTAITGLAVAGRLLGEPAMVERAARAARFVLAELRPAGGPLFHGWREGKRSVPAFLGDYGFLVRGLLALHRADGDGSWLEAAGELTEEQVARLGDPAGGFFVAAESDDLLCRSKEIMDGALPGGNSVALLNLVELAELTGESVWHRRAETALKAFAPIVARGPEAVKTLALATRRYHRLREATSFAAPATAEETPRVVLARVALAEPGADGWRAFRLHVEIADGWHLYAPAAESEFFLPTTVEGREVDLRGLEYPPGATAALGSVADGPVPVYSGSVEVRGEVGPVDGDRAALLLKFQACDDRRCLEPDEIELAL